MSANENERKVLFVAGDDFDAKQIVSQIIRKIGGEPIDTGNLREGGQLRERARRLPDSGACLMCGKHEQNLPI